MKRGRGWCAFCAVVAVSSCGESERRHRNNGDGTAAQAGETGEAGTGTTGGSGGSSSAGTGAGGADGGTAPGGDGGDDSRGGEAGDDSHAGEGGNESGGTAGSGGSGNSGGAGGSGAGAGNGGRAGNGGNAGSGGAAGNGGLGGSGGGAGEGPVDRRLPVPCTAPLPTGYCFRSDPGDYIGAGQDSSASGPASVVLSLQSGTLVDLRLENSANGDSWFADFVPPAGERLVPGLYDPAQRYPFQTGGAAGLSVAGNGRGCNQLTGKFSVEELAREPIAGITRFSVTFEQHCEGGQPALRGVINYQANGAPDRTPAPDVTIPLTGKVFRIAVDATSNVVYGLDATNRRIARLDLDAATVTYTNVVQVPNDGCVDPSRGRLFVVNKGSSFITEYRTSDLSAVRNIPWTGTDWGPDVTHFKIYCAPDKLYVVDGAWAPALFTVTGLDGSNPVAVQQSIDGVGGLTVSPGNTDLYTWYQYGWSAGSLGTSVHRRRTNDLVEIDVSSPSVPNFARDPLDAPILLDSGRELVFVKNKIFDALNLEHVVFSLPSTFDFLEGAAENAYALDAARDLVSTKNYVYELTRYDVVASTLRPDADQLFFDTRGRLWFLSVTSNTLEAQIIRR